MSIIETIQDTLDQERHAQYRAYLYMMADHGCDCVALTYDEWALLPNG